VEQRASAIRAALRDAGASKAQLPAVLIENSSRCDTNAAGQQVLPNDQAWLPALMTSVRDPAWRPPAKMLTISTARFEHHPALEEQALPNVACDGQLSWDHCGCSRQ